MGLGQFARAHCVFVLNSRWVMTLPNDIDKLFGVLSEV